MRESLAVMALVSAGLLAAAVAAPVAAADGIGIAEGSLTWDGRYDPATGIAKRPGRTSVLRVRDGAPGGDSTIGDRGWYRFSERNDRYDQRMTMSVRCVRVEDVWAEFAGVVVRATGNFRVGNVFLVTVVDLDTPVPYDLHIGMRSYEGTALSAACDAAVDGEQSAYRKGRVTGGYLDVSVK